MAISLNTKAVVKGNKIEQYWDDEHTWLIPVLCCVIDEFATGYIGDDYDVGTIEVVIGRNGLPTDEFGIAWSLKRSDKTNKIRGFGSLNCDGPYYLCLTDHSCEYAVHPRVIEWLMDNAGLRRDIVEPY